MTDKSQGWTCSFQVVETVRNLDLILKAGCASRLLEKRAEGKKHLLNVKFHLNSSALKNNQGFFNITTSTIIIYRFYLEVLPVWLMSHLQLRGLDAASLLPCCDSRHVHQTASPPPASADPSAADAGSVTIRQV